MTEMLYQDWMKMIMQVTAQQQLQVGEESNDMQRLVRLSHSPLE